MPGPCAAEDAAAARKTLVVRRALPAQQQQQQQQQQCGAKDTMQSVIASNNNNNRLTNAVPASRPMAPMHAAGPRPGAPGSGAHPNMMHRSIPPQYQHHRGVPNAHMARPGYRVRPGHPYGQPPNKMARTAPIVSGVNAPAVKALPKIDFPKVNSTSFVRVLGCTMHEECMNLAKRNNLLSRIDRQRVKEEDHGNLDSERFGASVLAKNITIVEGLLEASGLSNDLFSFASLEKVTGPTKPARRMPKRKSTASSNTTSSFSSSTAAAQSSSDPAAAAAAAAADADTPKASVPVAVFKHSAVSGPCKIREERVGTVSLSNAVHKLAVKQAEQEAQERAKESLAAEAKRPATRRISTRAAAAAAAKEAKTAKSAADTTSSQTDDAASASADDAPAGDDNEEGDNEAANAPSNSPTANSTTAKPASGVAPSAGNVAAADRALKRKRAENEASSKESTHVRCARQSLGHNNENWKLQRLELQKLPECIRFTSPVNVLHIHQSSTLKIGPQLSIKETGVCSPLREGTNRYRTFSINHGPGQEEWGAVAASHAEAARQLYGSDFGKIFPNVGYLIRNGIPVMYGLLQRKELVGISPGTVFWTMARGDMVSSSWNFLERAVSSFRLASEVRPMINLALDLAITELEAAKQKSATLSNPLLGLLTSQLEHALDREESIRRQALEHQFRPAPEPVGSNATHCEDCHRELFHHYFYCSTCDCLGPEKSMDLNATGTTATLNHAALAIIAASKKAQLPSHLASGSASTHGPSATAMLAGKPRPTAFASRRPAPGGMVRPVPSQQQAAMHAKNPQAVNAAGNVMRPTHVQLDAQRRSAFSNTRGGMQHPIKTERPAARDLETRSEPGEPVRTVSSSSSAPTSGCNGGSSTSVKSEPALKAEAQRQQQPQQQRPGMSGPMNASSKTMLPGGQRPPLTASTASSSTYARPVMANSSMHRPMGTGTMAPGMHRPGMSNGAMAHKSSLGKINTLAGPEKKTASRRKPRSPVPTWLRVDSRVIVNDSGQIGTVTKSGHGFYTVQLDGTTKTVLKRRNGLSSPAAVRSNVVFSCSEQEAEMLGTSPDSIATWRELVGGSFPGGKILPPCPPLGMHGMAYGKPGGPLGKDDHMARSSSSACAIANAVANPCRMSGVLGGHAGVRPGMSHVGMHPQARSHPGMSSQPARPQWAGGPTQARQPHPHMQQQRPGAYPVAARPGYAAAAQTARPIGGPSVQGRPPVQQQQQQNVSTPDKTGVAIDKSKGSAHATTAVAAAAKPGPIPAAVPQELRKVLRSRPAVFCSECWQRHRAQHNGHLTLCLERWYLEDLRMRVQEVAQLLRTRTASIEHLVVKPPTTIEEMLGNVHLARARDVPVARSSLARPDLAPRRVAPNQMPHPITSVMKPIIAGVVDRDLCIRVWHTEQQRVKKMASSVASSATASTSAATTSATSNSTVVPVAAKSALANGNKSGPTTAVAATANAKPSVAPVPPMAPSAQTATKAAAAATTTTTAALANRAKVGPIVMSRGPSSCSVQSAKDVNNKKKKMASVQASACPKRRKKVSGAPLPPRQQHPPQALNSRTQLQNPAAASNLPRSETSVSAPRTPQMKPEPQPLQPLHPSILTTPKATRGPSLIRASASASSLPFLPLDPFEASPLKGGFTGPVSSSSIVSDLDQCSIPDSPGWNSFLLADDTERALFSLDDDSKSVSSLTSAAASNEEVQQLLDMKREISDSSSASFFDDPVTDDATAAAAVAAAVAAAEAQDVGVGSDPDSVSIFDENDFGMSHMSVVDPLMDVQVSADGDRVPSSGESAISVGPVAVSLANTDFSEWLTEIC
ncbi:Lysine-specific demethylase 6B [Hondaea fermentalgiana]|uniref:Lysine-specific demethylase 6B n=1 Tax=Hondaea fermentalgiana TaxID=2315210 RepID=A0A2R5GM69_9STRA|nr:Lysine-specific demethylase 6B [Hondaea fermentalgiana]|eukprot:GBG31992.1 Lysine-specific demethylase 6B [Hondaea fermentalgiana]